MLRHLRRNNMGLARFSKKDSRQDIITKLLAAGCRTKYVKETAQSIIESKMSWNSKFDERP